MIRGFIKLVGSVNDFMGRIAGWLCTILMLLIGYDVTVKYLFNYSNAAVFELQWHLFALIFLLGAPFTLKKDRHVRVDVLYGRMNAKQQAWVNLIGVVLFLLPFCWVVIDKSWIYARNSFLMGEGSPDPVGLPYRFIIKGSMIVAFFLLGLQGIALALESLLKIISPREDQA